MTESFDHRTALSPDRSVVIEACAGSGKTWLLVSRIVRLLLAGAEPSEILAITFTRKAAQEMESRLREWLRLLATGTDEEVRGFLRERALTGEEIEAALPRARRLYETVLSAQPALTINTFHGWFLQLLQRAPLDSAAAGNFSLLDQTSTLMEEAWQSFAEDLAAGGQGETAAALQALFRGYGLTGTRKLLLNFVAKRAEWWAYANGRRDPVGHAAENLRRELGVDPGEDVPAALFADASLALDLQSYLGLLESNTDRDRELAGELFRALQAGEGLPRFERLQGVFFTQKGEPKKRKASKEQAKRLGAAGEARLLELHGILCARLEEAKDRLAAQAAWRFNLAGLRCGAGLLAAYQRLKEERQQLDFTDVEWRIRQLLHHGDHAEYMQYKLDSRYRHILLDEFQDTNPLQWQVMQSWLAASAAADRRPTVFVVGDPKQSIYRFRRAEARLFDIAADYLERHFGAVRLSQNTSRRSAPAVIEAVNRVFAGESEFSGFRPHTAHHLELPGTVEVLPLSGVHAAPEPAAGGLGLSLRDPLCEPRPDEEDLRREAEAEQLAAKIASIAGAWRVADEVGGQRPAEYRDILVLVRRRTWLATYERALRAARIPYLSSRRGGLLDTLECSDLSALLEFLITPFADLRLAQVLRSPLFGCGDEDLMALALSADAAEGESDIWWRRLVRAAEQGRAGESLQRALRLLRGWQGLADRLPVHDLLDRIYFEGEVLARYRAAVPEAMAEAVAANLHAFLELALDMDSGRYPSLARFLNEVASLRRAADESPDEGPVGDAGNAVRILTIHGAKGLEAPIVWLLDANAADRNEGGYRVLLDWPPDSAAPRHFSLFSRREELGRGREAYLAEEAAHARREDFNLLYVAMTRPRQALIVSGCDGGRGRKEGGESAPAGSWYGKIKTALEQAAPSALPQAEADRIPAQGSPRGSEPAGVMEAPLPPATGRRDISGLSAARRYGINLHALLEWLGQAGLSGEAALAAQKTVLQAKLGLADGEFGRLWEDAVGLLQAPHLKRFFDPAQYRAAYSELPYQTAAGETRRIDRLVEFEDCVWILDYKTGGEAGQPLDRLAAPHLVQLEEYRRAMREVFPGKPVRCALIFGGGRLFEVEGQGRAQ